MVIVSGMRVRARDRSGAWRVACVRAYVVFERACACTRNTSWEAWSVGETYGDLVHDPLEASRELRAGARRCRERGGRIVGAREQEHGCVPGRWPWV